MLWGDGADTLVYGDAWIPRPTSFRSISPPVLDQETKIIAFIFPNGVWNIELLKLCFYEEDVRASANYHKDRWIWHYTNNGIYSVKNCNGDAGSSSDPRAQNSFWRKVWSLEIPQKLIFFNWRAIHKSRPCKANLLKRKIVSDDACPICIVNSENLIHVVWSCPGAQKVWKKVRFMEVFKGLQLSTYGDFFEACSKKEEMIFNGAVHLTEEYGDLMRRESNIVIEKASKWSHPPVGKFKLNVDAAYIPDTGVGGIGAVIRNEKGEVMVATALPLHTATSPKHAEIMALQFGLNFAWDAGFSSILVESDSQTVVNNLNTDEESFAPKGHLIDDVKRSLQQLENATVSFIPSGCNQVGIILPKEMTAFYEHSGKQKIKIGRGAGIQLCK
ncbi:hypothetical protein PRUPE_3G063400 [Prunus persica]|uniref:RNase H type-1 domain-containing protein n=1 Tax=Prunus persica TaxID=3760 RepID=M5X848_PRUPE|nr:hypothetical protein PRUPE_3G063400 [Prunus persica]